MVESVTCVSERRRDIIGLEIWKLLEHLLRREPRGKQVEHVADANAKPTNARATATLLSIHGDSICEERHGIPRFVGPEHSVALLNPPRSLPSLETGLVPSVRSARLKPATGPPIRP